MLDVDLAQMYGVATKVLIQAVKRNSLRFPEDFVFQLNEMEFVNLRSQSVTSSWGGRRYMPYAFTEQGVSMLSSVLHSRRAIQVNIAIMRTFVKIRQMLSAHKELAGKIKDLERRIQSHDHKIEAIFEAIHELMDLPEKPRRAIGFRP
ncbi:MAG: ORF6N domain-containing protein [Elusimicrobiales bacterium]|jgi:hypothetical protein